MKVKIGISARHVHLTKDDLEYLFGEGYDLNKYKELTQPGEYACEEKVSIIGEKGRIDDVRIVGPLRSYTQVEISKTDAYLLGLNPPVRNSGDLKDSEEITIEYNGKKLLKNNACIIATRHIHINSIEMEKYNLKNNQKVKLKIDSIKGGILDNVFVKSSDNYVFEAHLDLDDANANFIKSGDLGEIINE